MKIIKIKDLEIDLDKIENPKLKRVIEERCREFMFSSTSGSSYSERHTDRGGHKDYSEHGDYQESASHTDLFSRQGGHSDYTDTAHTDHNDYVSSTSIYIDS